MTATLTEFKTMSDAVDKKKQRQPVYEKMLAFLEKEGIEKWNRAYGFNGAISALKEHYEEMGRERYYETKSFKMYQLVKIIEEAEGML